MIIVIFILVCGLSTLGQMKTDSTNKFDENGKKTGKWVRTWMETGKVSAVEYYIAGKKNGLCKYYRENGDLQNETEYKDDTLHGVFKFYAHTGIKEVGEHQHGRREGMTRIYDYKWRLVEEYESKNDRRNGIYRYYHNSGRVSSEGHFINGKETGTRKVYTDSDQKEVCAEIDYLRGRRLERRLYKNGELVKTEQFDPVEEEKQIIEDVLPKESTDSTNRYDEDGKKTGKWLRLLAEPAGVSAVEYYIAGKRNGLCKYYRKNGDLENEIEFKNDTMHGVFKFYDFTGIKVVAAYQHGKREGLTQVYDYKWRLIEDYESKNDRMNGIRHSYHTSGRVSTEGHFIDGKESGTRLVYTDSDAKQVRIEIDYLKGLRLERRFYKKGKLIKIEKFDPVEEAKEQMMDDEIPEEKTEQQ